MNQETQQTYYFEVFCPKDWEGSKDKAAFARKERKAAFSGAGWETAIEEYEDNQKNIVGLALLAWAPGSERPWFGPMFEAQRQGPQGPVALGQEELWDQAVSAIIATEYNEQKMLEIINHPVFATLKEALMKHFAEYLIKPGPKPAEPQITGQQQSPEVTPPAPAPAPLITPKLPEFKEQSDKKQENVTYVDNTILSSVAQCSTQAFVQYVMQLRSVDEGPYLEAGQAVHLALERHLKGGTIEESLKAFDEYYYEWSKENIDPLPEDSKVRRVRWENVRKIIQRWIEANPLTGLPFKVFPQFVEKGFQLPLVEDGSIVLVGRIDAIIQNREETAWRILDHKSTGQISNWQFLARNQHGSQLTGYTEGGQACFSAPVEGAMVNAIELSELPGSDKTCKEHGVPYKECSAYHAKFQFIGPFTKTEHEKKAWYQGAASLGKKFRELKETYTEIEHVHLLQMQGRFNGACIMCGLKDWCEAGRPTQPELIGGMLKHDDWEPFEGAFGKRDRPRVRGVK